tara:strand:- start:84 stop:692 length:609 start_codon:yes stop_codon:yes gene_type:complete
VTFLEPRQTHKLAVPTPSVSARQGFEKEATLADSSTSLVDIDVWYRKYGAMVYRRCLSRLRGNENLAETALSNTFFKAHKYRKSFRGDSKPSTWLCTIADRCALDLLKKQAKSPQSFEPTSFVFDVLQTESDGVLGNLEREQVISLLLQRAEPKVQQMVIHRYFDELDHQEIAKRMNVNEKTIRRKLSKFLENARKFMERQS